MASDIHAWLKVGMVIRAWFDGNEGQAIRVTDVTPTGWVRGIAPGDGTDLLLNLHMARTVELMVVKDAAPSEPEVPHAGSAKGLPDIE